MPKRLYTIVLLVEHINNRDNDEEGMSKYNPALLCILSLLKMRSWLDIISSRYAVCRWQFRAWCLHNIRHCFPFKEKQKAVGFKMSIFWISWSFDLHMLSKLLVVSSHIIKCMELIILRVWERFDLSYFRATESIIVVIIQCWYRMVGVVYCF